MALRRFFETAERMPWYPNTLFCITADHASLPVRPDYTSLPGVFSVPIVFFHPDGSWARLDKETVAQHADIMPTILNYLGVDQPYVAFGKDLLHREGPNVAVEFAYGLYYLILDDFIAPFDGERVTGLYRFKTDPFFQEDVGSRYPETRREMETLIKAYVQQYNTRMRTNRLTPE